MTKKTKQENLSPTFKKLMYKYGCKTPDEYRAIRKANRAKRNKGLNMNPNPGAPKRIKKKPVNFFENA